MPETSFSKICRQPISLLVACVLASINLVYVVTSKGLHATKCPRAKLTTKHIRLTAQLVDPMWGPFTFRGRTAFSEVAIVLTSLFSLVLIPQFDGWPVAYCVDSIKQMYLNVALPGLLNRNQRLS